MNSFVRFFLVGIVTAVLTCSGYLFFEFKKLDHKYQDQITQLVDGYLKVEPKIKTDLEKFVFPDYLKSDYALKNADGKLKLLLKPSGSLADIPMSKFSKTPYEEEAWSVDFKWMKDLGEYGYWDFASSSFQERMDLVPSTPFAIQLLNYSKVRYGLLKQNYKRAGGDAAVVELRSLQRLLFSSQVPILTMILNSMMNAESELVKTLNEKKIKFKFQPVTAEQSLLLRAFLRNSGQLLSPFLPKDVLAANLNNPKLEPILCSGITVNMGMILASKAGFESRFPEQSRMLIDSAQKANCRMHGLQEYFRSPTVRENFHKKYTVFEMARKNGAFFSIRFLSFMPLAISEPFAFRMMVLVMNRAPAFAMF